MLEVAGQLRRFATLFAVVAVIASVAAGCGGGSGSGSSDSVSVKTAPPPEAAGQAPSAAVFVARIDKADPEQINRLCLKKKVKGEGAAYADFKRGYALAFPEVKLPPKKVFDEIIKHCG
jgi:hypothetical protein